MQANSRNRLYRKVGVTEKRVTLVDMRADVQSKWTHKISTKYGYESFANFLAEQLSVEVLSVYICDRKCYLISFNSLLYMLLHLTMIQNLLFITEYVQLKGLIVEDEWFKCHIGEEVTERYRLELPPELPVIESPPFAIL